MPTQATGAATKRAPETQDKELTREERIIKHLPLVRAIASRVREGLPVQVELDDLAHAGVMGLFDAVDKYNPDKGVVFHLYAKHRIRGAILDSLRQLDWASRDLRKRYKGIEAIQQQEAQRQGRAPTEEEVANAMGLSQPQLQKQKRDLQSAGLKVGQPQRIEITEAVFTEPTEDSGRAPDCVFAHGELRGALDQAVETLPPRYQKVIRLYYNKEQTMKQIGTELGVNESRVSQIHKTALEKLNVALRSAGCSSASTFLEDAQPA